MTALIVAVSAVAGAGAASLLACLPGLHVYNLLALVVLGAHALASGGSAVPPEVLVPLAAGMVTAYALVNTLPSVVLAAPDESAFFTVLPGQKYLMEGRGYEAVVLTTLGGLAGVMGLVTVGAWLAPRLLPAAVTVFRPHAHWVLWCVIAFMLMSEWPKGWTVGVGPWRRLLAGWRSLGAGLLTFLLSGLLGFLLFYRSPVPVEAGFQGLMPAFVGLFTIPWLLLNTVTRVSVPPQRLGAGGADALPAILYGSAAGSLGGVFAAFFPGVTGGVGGFLAGHATALRDDRAFLVSQGASKAVYYAGGLLLFFVPGVNLTRGGAAWMLRTLAAPRGPGDYYAVLAATALGGAVALVLIGPLARAVLRLAVRTGYARSSAACLVLVCGFVAVLTGWQGAAVMLTAAGIGLIPVLYGSRRMNCLGVILLPLACNMSGVGPRVAGWLGLMH